MQSSIRTAIWLMLVSLFSLSLSAQIVTPQPSPSTSFEQAIGLSTVSMEYSRPGVKGRTIFGDLVPYGKIWRTGANASTKITFSDSVKLAGNKVEAGTYAIYTIPGKQSWTVMLYTDLGLGGNVGGYNKENEYLRFTVKPQAFPMKVESMNFMLQNLTTNSAVLVLVWDETMVPMTIEVEVDAPVMDQISRVMAGPSANDYYRAAVYYYNSNRDLDQALEWIDQSLASREAYWVMTWKARIQAKMGDYEAANATSKMAMGMAQEAGNPDYVKINQDLQAEIKGKM
ncbi:MAG: DUF2911 domain-containing protein [Bacteroidota bacterium]